MYDMLPFPPSLTATDTKEQVVQLYNYLIQFKETLEFLLMNISVDNLSPELVTKLNSLGADIEKANTDREEEVQQVSGRMITVSDVLNSSAYKTDLTNMEEKMQGELEESLPPAVITAMNLRINFETGNLEYDKEVEE